MEISPESLLSKKFQSVQYYLFLLKKRSFQTIKVYLHKKREIIKIIEALYSTKIKKKCFDLLKKSFKQHKEKNKKYSNIIENSKKYRLLLNFFERLNEGYCNRVFEKQKEKENEDFLDLKLLFKEWKK